MSLSHAILGLLQKESMTGYDLKTRCFDQSIAHFWPADQSQIYRNLDKLAKEGWAHSDLQVQQERPNRKVYSITEAGRAELARWLTSPQEIPIYREPFLIQLFFGQQLANQELIQIMQEQLRQHQRRLDTYDAIPLPAVGTPGLGRRYTLERLTLDLGVEIQKTYIAWLQHSIDVVAELEAEEVPA